MVRRRTAASAAIVPRVLVLALVAVELCCIYLLGRRVLDRLVARAVAGGRARRWCTWAFLAPGVALHEGAHALAATALLGRVTRFVPFAPRPMAGGGVLLGEVRYRTAPLPVLGGAPGRAAIGLAPLVVVPVVVYVLGCVLVTGVAVGDDPADLARGLVDRGPDVGSALWLLLALSAGIGLLPSPTDHRDLPQALALLAAIALGWLAWRGGLDRAEGQQLLTDALGPATFVAQLLAPAAAVALVGALLLRR